MTGQHLDFCIGYSNVSRLCCASSSYACCVHRWWISKYFSLSRVHSLHSNQRDSDLKCAVLEGDCFLYESWMMDSFLAIKSGRESHLRWTSSCDPPGILGIGFGPSFIRCWRRRRRPGMETQCNRLRGIHAMGKMDLSFVCRAYQYVNGDRYSSRLRVAMVAAMMFERRSAMKHFPNISVSRQSRNLGGRHCRRWWLPASARRV